IGCADNPLLLVSGFISPTPRLYRFQTEPAVLLVNEGESVNITCSLTTKGTLVGIYLKREVVNAMEVLYIANNGRIHTVSFLYKDRIDISFLSTEVRITLHQLHKNDTALYVCNESILEMYEPNCVSSKGTILVVKGIVCFSKKIFKSSCESPVCVSSVTGCSKPESEMVALSTLNRFI
uniref:Ig-like domain-containing protein n=1 Tax=Chelydra serpentina TaxID=8475 RepID=A0A8C3SS91_CHESE